MEDVKENEMQGGVPVRLRGLKADGSSISPTMEEVTAGLPVATPSSKGLMRSDQSLLVDTLNFSFGVSGGDSNRYFRLGRFNVDHYSPIRLCASHGYWHVTSRKAIDIIITRAVEQVIVSGTGYSAIGYVLGTGYIDVYYYCTSGESIVGTIFGKLLDGRISTIVIPEGIVFIP